MDHAKKALSRVYWQYRNAPKMREWLQILPKIAQAEIEAPLGQIVDLLDIDSASGHQLEIIGRIAGIDRPRMRSDALQVFAYNGTIGAQPYDVAPYRESGAELPTILMPDYLFRALIRSKIMRNNGTATLDDIKVAVDFIFGVESTIIDWLDMSMSVVLSGSDVSANLLALAQEFDIIPRPQGVRIRQIGAA